MPSYTKTEHTSPEHTGPERGRRAPQRSMMADTFFEALHSDQGQPCDVEGEPARLYARPDGIHVHFAEAGRGRIKASQIAVGIASDRIRLVTEAAYNAWLARRGEVAAREVHA